MIFLHAMGVNFALQAAQVKGVPRLPAR